MFKTPKDNSYELIDSGNSMKLERFGDLTMLRPEPEAIWNPEKIELWDDADFKYVRESKDKWNKKRGLPDSWVINYGGIDLLIKPTAFKHTGLFPEQLSNWQRLQDVTKSKKLKVLNLFGYTGAFSVFALKLGHHVTHVDSSQGVNDWLKENCKLNNLDTNNLKIITDDVNSFVKRLSKRGETFDVILLDPPAFGHGAKKEIWKIEEDLPNLINSLGLIMSGSPVMVVLSGYAAGYSAETYKNLLLPIQKSFGGKIEADVMSIEDSSGRNLSIGIAARWINEK